MEQSNEDGTSKTEQIRFLSDQPLTAEKEREMRFGHLGIAENLRKVISICPPPFTIGLFGKWGTGKTTILNVLREKLRADKIAVVNFDVWKHEDDFLRRTFLKETTKQLEKGGYLLDFVLSERLDAHISRTFEGGFTFDKSRIKALVPIVAAIVVAGLVLRLFWPQYLGTYLSIVFGGGLVAAFLLWLLQQTMTTETITTATDRLQDPHEFEAEFKKIISKMSPEKLLVIIDNLDRASHEKAVELLSTIKTFLEQKKCIFLIACDDEAIKKHLEGVYIQGSEKSENQTPFDADEFLRKFFNTFLRIPEFIDTELQTYTEYMLKETHAPKLDSSGVAYVITSAFRDNPRQIKQFINTLLAHFLLAEERESGSGPLIIPKGTVTNNVAFLAKVLIIRQQFPREYEKILKGESIDDDKPRDFLRATKSIVVKDIRPFHYLKLSEEELGIPGIKELELALVDNKVELVEEKIKALKTDSQQVASFNRFILSLIDRNKGRRIPLSNIVSSSLLTVQHQGLKLDDPFYNKIADLLNDDGALGPELQNFEPTLVFDQVLSRCNEGDRNGIIDRYIDLLSKHKENEETSNPSPDYVPRLLKELVGHKDWLGVGKQEVSKALADRYYTYEMLSIFKGNPDDQKDFVSEEAIANFVSTFSSEDIEAQQGIRDKTDLFLDFKGIIGANALQAIITKLRELLDAENQKPYREEKENLIACIQDIFGAFGKLMPVLPQDILNPFADAVTQGINAVEDWTQKKIFVLTCLWLVDMCGEPRKSNINKLTRTFFSDADVESMNFVFDKLNNDKKKDELIERYNDVFQQRVLQDQRTFDSLYPLAPKDTRTQWLITLINSAHQRALTKLNELNYKVDDKKNVVATLLTRVEEVPPEEREGFYNICNKMKCANDIDLNEKFASHLKSLLKNTNPDLQKACLTVLQDATYLSATQKRDIVRETVEWLRTLPLDNAGQPGSAQSVLIYWHLLPPPLQGDFLDFIFDKLIKRGVNIENIRLGFEILRKAEPKPKYEDGEHSAYFDDILARAEAESNAEIKSELVEGLFSLKPDKVNRRNEDFWRKVEGLKP